MTLKKVICIYFILLTTVIFPTHGMSKNTWMPRSFASYLSRQLIAQQSVFEDVCIPVKYRRYYKQDTVTYKNESGVGRYFEIFFENLKSLFLKRSKRPCHDRIHIFSCVPEYMHSLGSDTRARLGSLPFWSGTNVLTIGNNDGKADLDAYQLGLGDVKRDKDGNTILGSIKLTPDVKHVGADLLYMFVQHRHDRGFFFKVHAPIGAMIVYSNLREVDQVFLKSNESFMQTTQDIGAGSEDISYQSPEYPTIHNRPRSVLEAFHGGSSHQEILDGNAFKPFRLRRGKIIATKEEFIRVGDIGLSLGYNFHSSECSLMGLAFKAICPTGNVPKADYMLEPIFGRGGVWGFGAELIGHHKLWQQDDEHYLDLQFQAEVLHLRPGRRYGFRSFDLKQNGLGSKYLLIQHYMGTLVRDAFNVTTEQIVAGQVQPAVNHTTLPVHSKFNAESTATLLFNYRHNGCKVGLGFEGWARSKEHLTIDMRAALDLRLPSLNDFAVVGRQKSSYLIDGQPDLVETFYCEPLAKINKSQDAVVLTGMTPNIVASTNLPNGIKDARIAANRISKNVYDAVDVFGAAAESAYACKIFGQCSYTFYKHHNVPSVGVIAGIEYGGKANNTVSMWSLALHGSIFF